LFFKILFAEAARCAGVDTSFIPDCVLANVFDVIFSSDDTEVVRVRRSLAKESNTCEQPTTAELSYFVSFLLMEAEQSCTANNANLDADLDRIFQSLVSIFGASDCWGVDACGDDAITDDWRTPVVQMDGTFCNLGLANVNASSTRTIDLSYYYLLETASTSAEDAVLSIEAIEQAFVTYVCSWERRRSLEDTTLSFEPDILAVDSNPLDSISSKCKHNMHSWEISILEPRLSHHFFFQTLASPHILVPRHASSLKAR
jgi:hypothetical protein